MPSMDKDTFEGALRVLHKNVGELKQLMDADLPWTIQIETMILDKLRSPERQLQQMGLMPSQDQNPQGNAALGLPGAPPMGPPPMGPGGGGMAIPPSPMLGSAPPPGMSAPPPGPSEADVMSLLGAGV